jgi:hypothetical protein
MRSPLRLIGCSSIVENGRRPRTCPTPSPPQPGYGANVVEGKVWCSAQAGVLAMIHEAGKGTAPNAVWTGTQAEVLALIKEAGGGPKTGVCHNCGKSDHWAQECKEPRKERAHSGVPNWKRVPLRMGHLAPRLSTARSLGGAPSAAVGRPPMTPRLTPVNQGTTRPRLI